MPVLKIGPPDFVPRLVVFDKDGTLIDFNFMWGEWIVEFARRLELVFGKPISGSLFSAFGYDPKSRQSRPDAPLAVFTNAMLRTLASEVLCAADSTPDLAQKAVAAVWFLPDPASTARPLADLPHVFKSLRERGIKSALATSDDRISTESTLATLGIAQYVDALVAADDGCRNKPAPDMILHVSRLLGVEPAHTVMVGDAITDLQMGRAAGAGLVVGALSGVTSESILRPYADILISSVGDLV